MKTSYVWVLTAGLLAAQDVSQRGPLSLSLKRAVELATSREGSAKVQLSGEAFQQAEARSKQARSALLPNLDASVTAENQTVNLSAMGLGRLNPFPGIQFPTLV